MLRQLRREVEPNKTTAICHHPCSRDPVSPQRGDTQIDRVLRRHTILAGQTERKRQKTFTDRLWQKMQIRIQQTVRHWKIKNFPTRQQTKNSKRRHIQINFRWTDGLTDVMILLGENEL